MLVVLLLRLCNLRCRICFIVCPNMDPSSADKPLARSWIFAWTTHEVLETDSLQHLMCLFRRCGAVFSWASCFESCALDIQPYLLRFGVWIYLNIFRSQKQASKHLSDETLQQLKQFGASQSYGPLLTLLLTPWSWLCEYHLDVTLQGTNISHLGKRKIIFKMPFLGGMLVPWRVSFTLQSVRILSVTHFPPEWGRHPSTPRHPNMLKVCALHVASKKAQRWVASDSRKNHLYFKQLVL